MKKTIKFISGIFLLTITLNSCSSEIEEQSSEINALDMELALENMGVLQVKGNTYIFKNTGETVKFINQTMEFDFQYTNEMNFTAKVVEAKHQGEELVITNPETSEFIKLTHLVNLKNGSIQFDAELSNGQKFSSLIFKAGKGNSSEAGKWHEELSISSTTVVLGAVIEMSNNHLSSQCKSEIAACATAGGRSSVSLNKGKGWFSTSETCNVVCR